MVAEIVSQLKVAFRAPVSAVIAALQGNLCVPVPKKVFGDARALTWSLSLLPSDPVSCLFCPHSKDEGNICYCINEV